MTDRKEVARKALVEAVILKHLKAAHERTRAELGAMFEQPDEREVATLLDHRIGTVSLEGGGTTWTVTDDAAFTEWALENYPHEVHEVQRFEVGETLRRWVLETCRQSGEGVPDENGEMHPVPGVTQRRGALRLVERPDKHAGWVVAHWLGDAAERLGIEAGTTKETTKP